MPSARAGDDHDVAVGSRRPTSDRPHHGSELLRLGYARVADPDAADAGWGVVGWALEVLGWRNPAWPERIRRCVDVIARYADASA